MHANRKDAKDAKERKRVMVVNRNKLIFFALFAPLRWKKYFLLCALCVSVVKKKFIEKEIL